MENARQIETVVTVVQKSMSQRIVRYISQKNSQSTNVQIVKKLEKIPWVIPVTGNSVQPISNFKRKLRKVFLTTQKTGIRTIVKQM